MGTREATPSRSIDLAAWMAELDDAPAVLQLPADRPRPDALGTSLERVTATLPASFADSLAAAADDHGSDEYVLVLAAWQALLWRYTGERELLVGCEGMPAAGQGWLPVRLRVGPQAFRSLLKESTHALERSVGLGMVTASQLLDALGLEVNPGRHPIYQVGFSTVAAAGDQPAPGESDAPPCDVVLRWSRTAGGLEMALDYTPTLFDRARMSRMLGHLRVLLEGALAAPDTPITELPLLTEQDVEVLRSWNATAHPHRQEAAVRDLFADAAQRSPDSTAVEMDGMAVSYAELDRRAGQLAVSLRARGVRPDVTVAVSMDRSVELVLAVLAVLKAGGAYVPVDPAYPPARQSYMLENSEARLLLTGPGTAAAVPSGVEAIDVREAEQAVDQPSAGAGDAVRGEHLGYVIYTSGSTGQPKGVALPQAALTNLIEWQLRRPGFAHSARTLQFASLSFDVSFQELFTTWCSGGTLVLVDDDVRRDPRALLDHIVRYEVERVFLPFVALRGLADAAVTTGILPTSLREVYTAGEQLQVDDTIRTFFSSLPGCLLENQYGPSESHVVTAEPLRGPASTWPVLPSIGSPISNSSVHILDTRGQLLPPGVPGELHIGGVCLAKGYLGRPDLTAERFIEHPLADGARRLYRTGDLARWSEEGTIEFLGRADNQVKFRGFRIEPGEIGAVLSDFPGVRQCVARIAEVEGHGPRLAAYVVPAGPEGVSLSELHRFAGDRLPDYMVPSHIVVLDELPLTPSGKLDVKSLPDPTFDRSILGSQHVAPRSDVEQALAEIWQRLLGIHDIGVHDDFFDLGGDSLMAVEMFAMIAERLGRELPLGALAQEPTIAGLATRLHDDRQGVWGSLVPIRTSGSAPPLFCVHGGSGNVASFPLLARALPADRPVYGLQWDGLDGSRGATTVEAMAARYLAEVRAVQPHGPYYLVGQCVGALISRHMARLLLDAGEQVAILVMYDTPNLSSPSYRYPGSLPTPPLGIRTPANRLLGAVAETVRFLKGRRPRLRTVLTRLRRAVGVQVPAADRHLHASGVIVRAVWRHRVAHLEVPTLLIHTGQPSASAIGLSGRWRDGMLGWSDHVRPGFDAHLIAAVHNELPYEPEAVQVLTEHLEGAQGQAASGTGAAAS